MQRPLEQCGWTETRKNVFEKIHPDTRRLTEITFRDGKVEIQGEIETLEELLALYNTAKQIEEEYEKDSRV